MKRNFSGPPYVVVTGGGTGGHVFPAQSLTVVLQNQLYDVLYVTDTRGARFPFDCPHLKSIILNLPQTLSGSFGKVFLALKTLTTTIFMIKTFLHKRPDLVVGFGGYTSFPPLAAALLLRVPFMMHEQNAYAGRLTRWLAPYANAITGAFSDIKGLRKKDQKKIVVTGNPVRKEIMRVRDFPYTAPLKKIHILVIGGSQGAKVFSTVLPRAVHLLSQDIQKRLIMTQQCRPELKETTLDLYKTTKAEIYLEPFFQDMAEQYKKTHLVIARSGASTMSELAVVGRPALFIPLPCAMDDHQSYNARSIAEKKAGWYVSEKGLTPISLARLLEKILKDQKRLEKTAKKIHSLGVAQASEALAFVVRKVLDCGDRDRQEVSDKRFNDKIKKEHKRI